MIISLIEVVTLWSIQDAGLVLFLFIFITIIILIFYLRVYLKQTDMLGSKISNAPVCF